MIKNNRQKMFYRNIFKKILRQKNYTINARLIKIIMFQIFDKKKCSTKKYSARQNLFEKKKFEKQYFDKKCLN